jgi:hypothetical protein
MEVQSPQHGKVEMEKVFYEDFVEILLLKKFAFILQCCAAVVLASSCTKYPAAVEESLQMAGGNRGELQKVLRRYSRHSSDSLKFRAACYLVEHMRWHFSTQRIESMDGRFAQGLSELTQLYSALTDGLSAQEVMSDEVKTLLRWRGRTTQLRFDSTLAESEVREGIFPDLQYVNFDFLASHIDNAFRMRDSVEAVQSLSFEDFCRYILPYRSMPFPWLNSGGELSHIFSPYLNRPASSRFSERILRYNACMKIRALFGNKPVKSPLGLYGLFFHNAYDCTGIASYAVNVFRSCGIPAALEFNASSRRFAGRHFYCAVPDSTGRWRSFNPETELPGDVDFLSLSFTNTFRYTFEPQKNSPYCQRNEDEPLPGIFSTPCILEVTPNIYDVQELTLPFSAPVQNCIAYLYVFQKNASGTTAATWGYVNHRKGTVSFPNVMYNVVYFAAYLDHDGEQFFADPFWLTKDTSAAQGYKIHTMDEIADSDTLRNRQLVLTRKYPRKPNMVKLAESMVGTVFAAAGKIDFSDAKVLHTVTQAPNPYFQEVRIRRPKAYRYYRLSAPEEHPQSNISMVEFITDKKYGYQNVCTPTPVSILSPQDVKILEEEVHKVRLLDAPIEQLKKRASSDGNMQTAPTFRNINLRLKEPQVVTAIRYAPKNADNGVTPGDFYELMRWDNGWKSCGVQKAKYSYVEYAVPGSSRLYWLKNLTRGQEEQPFVVRNGRQQFLYYDVIN